MITPNRYHLWAALECHAFSKAEAVLRFSAEEDGMWVQWQDYARLKADAQVILKHLDEASADCARLKAEVERLRKAGDAMALSLANADRMEYGDPSEPIEGYMNREVIKAWNAAKEGKQP